VCSVLQLAVGLVRAVAGWAALKGLLFAVLRPFLCVFQLARFLVRTVFRTCVWTLCTVLKAPLCLGS
jgi:hypothetical protein